MIVWDFGLRVEGGALAEEFQDRLLVTSRPNLYHNRGLAQEYLGIRRKLQGDAWGPLKGFCRLWSFGLRV